MTKIALAPALVRFECIADDGTLLYCNYESALWRVFVRKNLQLTVYDREDDIRRQRTAQHFEQDTITCLKSKGARYFVYRFDAAKVDLLAALDFDSFAEDCFHFGAPRVVPPKRPYRGVPRSERTNTRPQDSAPL